MYSMIRFMAKGILFLMFYSSALTFVSSTIFPLSEMLGIPPELSGFLVLVLLVRYVRALQLGLLFQAVYLEVTDFWNTSNMKRWMDNQVTLESYIP